MAKQAPSTANTPLAEWIVAALGGAVLIGVFGFLLWQAFVVPDTPPDIQVQVDLITPVTNGFVVQFVARNKGSRSAEGVVVRGELRTGARAETGETTLDYVPARSETRGGIFFASDPRQGLLDIRPLGYEQP